jgi:tetratricopeptide (TPR) repeat protein
MRDRDRTILGALAGVLFVVGLLVAAGLVLRHGLAQSRPESQQPAFAQHMPQGHPFTREQTYPFFDAAKRAEQIADPLQRCLAYPDPPGSHWSHDVVAAYCTYRAQPTVPLAEVRQLIESGRAAELDRRFAAMLHVQQTQASARGSFDRAFEMDFNTASFDVHELVQAWLRQAPDSAFARAASGLVYSNMAFAARGTALVRNTPESNFESMDRLALQADGDLRRAIALNPRLPPAYDAMVSVGGYSDLGCQYSYAAADKGLAVNPGNFAIYDTLMWLAQPKWCGSEARLRSIWMRAQSHATANPLLSLIQPAGEFNLIDACKCSEQKQLDAYIAVLDHPSAARELLEAGNAARDLHETATMVIYLSEALRFDPSLDGARTDRIYGLVDFDNAKWAIDEADSLIAKSPDNEFAYKARAWAEMQGENDLASAQRDFLKATQLDPTDMWALSRLGSVYIQNGQQWDKARDVADQLIAKDPDIEDGWMLRAAVQFGRRQPAFLDTVNQIASRFRRDPKIAAVVARMRDAWAKRLRGEIVPGGPARSPRRMNIWGAGQPSSNRTLPVASSYSAPTTRTRPLFTASARIGCAEATRAAL